MPVLDCEAMTEDEKRDAYEKQSRDYYARKQQHREEILPLLGWSMVAGLVLWVGWLAVQAYRFVSGWMGT